MLAGQDAPLDPPTAEPERRRVQEDGVLHGRPRCLIRQARHHDARPALLHRRRRQPDVPCPGPQDGLGGRPDHLPGGVIEVRLHEPKRVTFLPTRATFAAHDHTQAVREVLPLSPPCPVANPVRHHGGHRPERLGQRHQDGRARRRSAFARLGAVGRRTPADQFHHGRRRHRQPAMRRVDISRSHRPRRADQPVRPQQRQGRADARDVDDGVDRPDLVEVDLLRRGAVDPCLCLRQAAKDRLGLGGRRPRQVPRVQDLVDGRQTPVIVLPLMPDPHLRPRDPQPVPHLRTNIQVIPRHRQRAEVPAEGLLVGAGVQEGPQEHVAARPGEGIHVDESHRRPLLGISGHFSCWPGACRAFSASSSTASL